MRLVQTVCVITAAVVFLVAYAVPEALPRDNGQWENSPLHVRRWFQGLRQPDNPRVSCCGEADAYEADIFEVEGGHYVAVITDGKGEIPIGTRIPVPNHKNQMGRRKPDGTRHYFHRRPRTGLLLRCPGRSVIDCADVRSGLRLEYDQLPHFISATGLRGQELHGRLNVR
jgi:hypothetical protein